jgi:CheY-like chemotaxis protein
LRVLVVDDNRDAAESLSMMLRLDGHEVRMAHDGPAALEVARLFRPEVVLLDIGLPGSSGYDVARQLQEQVSRPRLLVAMTGYGSAEDQRRSQEAGLDHHLVKPVDPHRLRELLARA